jgi:mono/diheme cytochrome c family protein
MVSFVRGFQGGRQVVDEAPQGPAAERAEAARRRALADPAPPAQGAQIARVTERFHRLCAVCHGVNGRGDVARGDLVNIPDFTRPAWQAQRSDAQMVASVLDGKAMAMPAFHEKLSRDQARELVALIRTFAPATEKPKGTAPDEFDDQFRRLREEFDALDKQRRTLNATPTGAAGTPKSTPPTRAPAKNARHSGGGSRSAGGG